MNDDNVILGKTILLIAVVQEQDSEVAKNALEEIGFIIGRLPSVGGFLGKRNVTLILGLSENDWEPVEKALRDSCSQRVEFIQMPLVSAPIPLPSPVPVTVGGAVLFGLDVEYYEVI